MKIAIIGAGAMGSLYGGGLSASGNEVYLVDLWKDHVDMINDKGLTIMEGKTGTVARPVAVTESKNIGTVDLAIIFVKSIHTEIAVKNNKCVLGENTFVLSLQNGYGNIEKIARFVKEENIIAGTTAHGATMVGPGCIEHAGIGDTHIGLVKNSNLERLEEVRNILEKAGFRTCISENVMELIWAKILINVGINALTAILQIRNGQLLEYEESVEMMNLAVTEAVGVANASGMSFDAEKTIEIVAGVASKTARNKSSMLQDRLNGRKTEIDTINGAIVSVGSKHGIETPVNVMLTNLIKIIEKTY